MQLRAYQSKIVDAVRQEAISGKKKIVMVLSTGGGKTAILFEISRLAVEKGGKVLLIVHRRDLAFQTQAKFEEYGMDAGIIMSQVEPDFSKPVQIASVWTYNRRLNLCENDLNKFYVDASLILIDEAHRSLSKTFQQVMGNYENKIVIGCTATPCLGSNVGMGEFYDSLVDVVPINQLIDDGYLMSCVYYGGASPDLEGVKTVRGDFDLKELGERSNTKILVGNVVDNWFRLASDKQTIVFCVNRKHARHLCDSFIKKGVQAAYLDAHSSDEERDDVLSSFGEREVQIIVNVALFQEFLDAPITDCIVIARSTKAMGLYRQMCGRGLRPYPGKKACLILDHGGCVQRLGYIDDAVEWTLDGKKLAWRKKTIRKKEKKIMECEECRFMFTGRKCPKCGLAVSNYGKKIETTDDELVELKGKTPKSTMEEKSRFFGMLEYHRRLKGYASGWSAHRYRARFSCWPKGLKETGPIEPDKAFYNWITYQNIKYHKGKAKAPDINKIMADYTDSRPVMHDDRR